MTRQYKLKGINDDHDTCEICGKTELKRVMWLVEVSEDGDEITEAFPAGLICGAKLLGIKSKNEAKVSKKVNEMAKEQVNIAIKKIMDTFVKIDSMLVPPQMVEDYKAGKLSRNQMIEKREEEWPILGFLNGRMTLEQAVKHS